MLKSKDIEIDKENPFANDQLDRKENAEILTQFILNADESLVICLDAPWGQGKTTFLRMWQQHLIYNQIPTLYYNAWENDFSDNALISLIGEISVSIEELSIKGNKTTIKKYLKKTKELGSELVKKTIPLAVKVMTAGVVDADKLIGETIATFAEDIAKEQIEQYESSKKTLKSFRETLTNLANSFSSKDEKGKPLVFIVDELDRCRPTFAIELLEKIKHLFNVDNIVFILGADKVQLGHSIRAVYGNDLDVNGYLRRFIDFDYLLPIPPKDKFITYLFTQAGISDYFAKKKDYETQHEGDQAFSIFRHLSKAYDLTLREQIQYCALLNICIKTTPTNNKLHPLLLCFLIALKMKETDLYKNIINNNISSQKMLEYFYKKFKGTELFDNNYGARLEAYFSILSVKENKINEVVNKYQELAENTTNNENEKRRLNRISEFIRDLSWDGLPIDYLVKKIEIANRFETNRA